MGVVRIELVTVVFCMVFMLVYVCGQFGVMVCGCFLLCFCVCVCGFGCWSFFRLLFVWCFVHDLILVCVCFSACFVFLFRFFLYLCVRGAWPVLCLLVCGALHFVCLF